jgi:hypothetical protein
LSNTKAKQDSKPPEFTDDIEFVKSVDETNDAFGFNRRPEEILRE